MYILFNVVILLFNIKLLLKKGNKSLFKVLLLIIKFLKSINKIIIIEIKIIKNLRLIILIFKLNLKISFEARDVIYINKINIPPIKIKNKE